MTNNEEGRVRRQTVPLQHAAEFPDETGQYDLSSIAESDPAGIEDYSGVD